MKLVMRIFFLLSIVTLLSFFMSCRAQVSDKAPIHLNPNMDNQEKYLAYGENPFFKDKRNMRPVPSNTVPYGFTKTKEVFRTGKVKGKFVKKNPYKLTEEFLKEGKERFEIYCSPCHGYDGRGNGIVVQRGFVPPPSYLEKHVIQDSDGILFDHIKNGVRTMPAYKHQMTDKEIWAVIAYIRVLQKAAVYPIDKLPNKIKEQLK